MPNKIKIDPETPIYFVDPAVSGTLPQAGSSLVKFTASSLLNGSGYMSDLLDLGPGPRTNLFEWRSSVTTGSSPIVGQAVEQYLVCSDGVNVDGNLGSGNQLVTAFDKRRNLMNIGSVMVDSSITGNNTFITSNFIQIYSRYVAVFWWNNTGVPLANYPSGNFMILTPVPDEIQ